MTAIQSLLVLYAVTATAYFNEALRAIKEDVSTGKINLNKYL